MNELKILSVTAFPELQTQANEYASSVCHLFPNISQQAAQVVSQNGVQGLISQNLPSLSDAVFW
jgi:hypothetical protein